MPGLNIPKVLLSNLHKKIGHMYSYHTFLSKKTLQTLTYKLLTVSQKYISSQPLKPLKQILLSISVLIHLVCAFLFAAQVVSWYKSSMLWLPSLRELPVWASKLATASSLPQKRNTNPFFMRNTQHTKWKRLQTPSEWFTQVKVQTICLLAQLLLLLYQV